MLSIKTNSRPISVLFLPALLTWALFLTGQLLGQNKNTGEIRGTIIDTSGAVIPGVTIKLTDTLTGVTQQAVSDSAGTYDAPYLAPGSYEMVFQKSGFTELVRSGIDLHIQIITINAQLQVGATTQTVTVKAPAPLIQQESSDRSDRLTSQMVRDLPNVGRDEFTMTELNPGANFAAARSIGLPSGGGSGGSGAYVSFNGQEAILTNWVFDGGSATYPQSFNQISFPHSLDAIAEMDVISDNASAEYGNGVGVVSVITKSGTNHWHGEGFEFVQNDALGARNFFAETKPPLRWNQFGGNWGGPIKHDKAFFFFNYQGTRQTSPSVNIITVPTVAERGGDFSAVGLPQIFDPATLSFVNGQPVRQPFQGNIIPTDRIDPVAAAILKFYPLPNDPGIVGNYISNGGSNEPINLYNAKIDYNISSGNRLTGSLIESRWDENFINAIPGPACASTCGAITVNEPHFTLTDTWTLRPNLVNELRFVYLRADVPWKVPSQGLGLPEMLGLKNPGSDIFPNITIGGAVSTSISGTSHFNLRQNVFVPSDDVTWIRGRHIFKFGGELNKLQVNNAQPWLDEGDFDFSGLFTRNPASSGTGLGLADFILGLPDTYSLDIAPDIGERSWNFQSFVQDDYKVKPNLTLNLGVRYQVQAGWSEVFNRLSNFDPTLNNPVTNTPGAIWFAGQQGQTALEATKPDLFAPRVGFAWSPHPNMAVRGAYGVFYIPWSADQFSNQNPAGFSITNFLTSTDQLAPIFSLVQGPPPFVVPSGSNRTPGILNGQSISYWPYNLPEGYSQQWNFGIQQQMPGGILVDGAYVGTKGTHISYPRDLNQVPQNLLGPGNAQLNRPYPQYQSISAQLFDGKSIYHSFQLSVKKPTSYGVTFVANYTISKTLDNQSYDHNTGGSLWQNAYDPNAMYGLSQLDVPQRVSGLLLYQLPFGSGRRFMNRGGVLNAILGGWETSYIFQAESGIPFTATIAGPNLSGSLAGTWLPNRIGNGNLPNPTIQDWFDTSAFEVPEPFTYGNEGRNVLRGPGFWDLDFALTKSFPLRWLGEAGSLQIRMESYDIFNHPNFGLPVASIGSLQAGQTLSATTNRNIQLGGRIIF